MMGDLGLLSSTIEYDQSIQEQGRSFRSTLTIVKYICSFTEHQGPQIHNTIFALDVLSGFVFVRQ